MAQGPEPISTDALGNRIVLGARYGYSRNSNGFTTVTLGTAKFVRVGEVRLIDCHVTTYLYGKPLEPRAGDPPTRPADVSILSNSIFPIPAKEAQP